MLNILFLELELSRIGLDKVLGLDTANKKVYCFALEDFLLASTDMELSVAQITHYTGDV